MKEEDLSPEARQRLKELERKTFDGGAWPNDAYFSMLRMLVNRDTSDVTEWEIKGQGIEALEESREKYRVAVELKAYAESFLGPDISKAVAKLPEVATLDDFLDGLMPNTGREVRRNRFMEFLRHEAETQQANDPPPPGLNIGDDASEEDQRKAREWIETQAQARFAALERSRVPALVAYDLTQSFRAWWMWWKRQDGRGSLTKVNKEKKMAVEERWDALIALLPNRTDDCGITKEDWRKAAKKHGLFSSLETFNRYVREIKKMRLVHIQEDGRFRQHLKKNAPTRKKDLA